jgi:hypothetical protein
MSVEMNLALRGSTNQHNIPNEKGGFESGQIRLFFAK